MGFSITGTIIALLILLPSLVFFLKFPPVNVPQAIRETAPVYRVLEKIGQMTCLLFMMISKDFFDIQQVNLYMILMIVCILCYYGLWLRYLRAGREFASLWKPVGFIPIPLAVFPVLAFGCAALWGNCIWLGVSTVLLAIGHWTVSWNVYRQTRLL
ncbi:hypothetical protein [Paenibacillus donghaensis]|uniref:Amino acid permease n=1 Tax=Paenibacillus donghaensis TaxID=414771 RepID=A0A2Z2KN24_9BACL|nr:hypothetical protein [Paenibacillus donghaensis]ASA21481.1 hypothetical protein B9T62_12245 [Paenibacillus donghaensis]